MVLGMKGMNLVPSSSYAGLRMYLLASGCIPFLLCDRKNIPLFIACVLPSLLLILFCDFFLNLFGVGYSLKGVEDSRYAFIQVRGVIAYVIIGGSCFALRLVVDKNDQLNHQLINELEEKNKIVQAQAENELLQLNHQLKERIKELTTLYKAEKILQQKGRVVDEVMQEFVTILPPGWQYPEITAARIVIGGIEFKTPNFSEITSKQKAEFNLPQGFKGLVEVVYLEEKPDESEGPFLKEERDLINMIAELLQTYFVRRYESDALKKSEANLNATINNTNVLIWSIDRNINLLAFNKPFFEHMKKYYGLEISIGQRILKGTNSESNLEDKWENFYKRVLEGEMITQEDNRFGIDFYYSLSPIVEEDGRITGVSVFADDITKDKQRAQELGEALKKVGELRLMALRSVMNPHFIFNVLNSIQFYIVANDRLNAVNYLSTFSKLIRSILTHSVHNKIKLEDEIEMLKNYTQLEMVRFENKFTFHLEIDPNLEIDTIEIPSLLVQPFVENAILHGLYNKQGTGVLTIRIKEDDDAIVFEIEDDGVGREAALKHKLNNPSAHKSMGVKLTEERLKLINENHNVSFKVEDLKNGDEPCGTRASIWIRT
jgi:PAS domain S-box-containing protein